MWMPMMWYMEMMNSCSKEKPKAQKVAWDCAKKARSSNTIASLVQDSENFSTLRAALEAADLIDVFKGSGPFTVFAPSDEAFAKLGDEKIKSLLEDKAQLAEILKFHVVPKRFSASELEGIYALKALSGKNLEVNTEEGVKIAGVSVVKADIPADNGIVHVVESVLIPS
jgi:uncharacterized surface protein with fasciclin (FAS1) repeats